MQEGSELTEASLGPPSGLRQAEYPGELAWLGPPLAQVVSVLEVILVIFDTSQCANHDSTSDLYTLGCLTECQYYYDQKACLR